MKVTTDVKILVNPRSFISGGSFRIDKGPTPAEIHSFRMAVSLHKECLAEGINTSLGIMVNDLALPPEERPKKTLKLALPVVYVSILKEYGLCSNSDAEHLSTGLLEPVSVVRGLPQLLYRFGLLQIAFESNLRNSASKNAARDSRIRVKMNGHTGFPVPMCVTIMGRFYRSLASIGYAQQIGFYTMEEKPEPGPGEIADKACAFGPVEGAISSGYPLQLNVVTWLVGSDGEIKDSVSFKAEMGGN